MRCRHGDFPSSIAGPYANATFERNGSTGAEKQQPDEYKQREGGR